MKRKILIFTWILITNIAFGDMVKIEHRNNNVIETEMRKTEVGKDNEKTEVERDNEEIEVERDNEEIEVERENEEIEVEKDDEETEVEIVATLIGDENGNIYYGENIDVVHPLASLTKLITIMVVFDEIREKKIKLEDIVEISKKVSKISGSKIKIKRGDLLTVEDLIKASLIRSANNATYALADYITHGNYDVFLKKMKDKVKSMGLEKTMELYTPAGLPDRITRKKMDVGTASDVYKVMLEVMKYPEILEITQIKETRIFNDKIKIRNTNSLLGVEGIKGLKTGTHNDAGSNIAVYNEKAGFKNFYVVLGGKNSKIRNDKILELDEKFHSENWVEEIINVEIPVANIDVIKGTKDHVELYPTKNLKIKKISTDNIDVIISRPKTLEAPLKIGEICGFFTIYKNGVEIEKGNLVLRENIPKKWYVIW